MTGGREGIGSEHAHLLLMCGVQSRLAGWFREVKERQLHMRRRESDKWSGHRSPLCTQVTEDV
jgi:hypothetical protein